MVGLMVFGLYLAIGGLCSALFTKAIHRALEVSPRREPIGQEELKSSENILLWQQDMKRILHQGEAVFPGRWKRIASLLIILFWLPLLIHILRNREGK